MSLQYLLDGYNIIHQIPHLSQGSLEDQRLSLIRFVENHKLFNQSSHKVTVIFDGQVEYWSNEQKSFVKVIFSYNESADDKIKRMVEESSQKKNVVVVTNDRAIQYFIKALGAKSVAVDEFVSQGRQSQRTSADSKGRSKEGKVISKTLEFKITEEFEKLWIKKK